MSTTTEKHPVSIMCDSSKHLQEQAIFVARRAKVHAEHTRKASVDLANLDIEGIFKQLHQMVEIVGGKSNIERPTQTNQNLPMAAE